MTPESPKTGKELIAWLIDLEKRSGVGLTKIALAWGIERGFPQFYADWNAEQVAEAVQKVNRITRTTTPEERKQHLDFARDARAVRIGAESLISKYRGKGLPDSYSPKYLVNEAVGLDAWIYEDLASKSIPLPESGPIPDEPEPRAIARVDAEITEDLALAQHWSKTAGIPKTGPEVVRKAKLDEEVAAIARAYRADRPEASNILGALDHNEPAVYEVPESSGNSWDDLTDDDIREMVLEEVWEEAAERQAVDAVGRAVEAEL